MFSSLKIGMLGLGLSALLALAGCQSSNEAAAPPSHEMSAMAGHCDGCKVTWVKEQQTDRKGIRILGYRETQKMECPDCKGAMENFFATGKMEHACKACGGNMVPCEGH